MLLWHLIALGMAFTPLGALGRIRTLNPLIRSQVLYPLSYECV